MPENTAPPLNDDYSPDYMAKTDALNQSVAAAELEREFAAEKQAGEEGQENQGEQEQPRGVFGDIMRGITEIPRAIAGGVRDAAQETIDMIGEAGDWLEEKFPLKGITPEFMEIEKPELPDIDDPKTTTGGMAKGVIQFAAGFFGAGKTKIFKAIQPKSAKGKAGKAAAQGAAADFTVFDPHEARLGDLIESFPALRNPVTEFLASDPDDSALEGRTKQALEGLLGGTVAEGFLKTLKIMRHARIARAESKTRQQAIEESTEKAQAIEAGALDILGDPNGRRIVRKMENAEAAAAGKTPKNMGAEQPEFSINWARIDSPDDIKKLMQETANAQKGDIDKSRRGVRTWQQTKLSAEQQNAWDLLIKRGKGEIPNGRTVDAEQTVALRQLWVSSANKLHEVSQLAAKNPSQPNLFAFRKMLATHYAIQKEVISARTEAARALNAWKIPVGGDQEIARQMDALLENSGGVEVAQELAKRIAFLADNDLAPQLSKFVDRGFFAKTRSAVAQVWINGLLSNPTTHMVNAMSNTSVAFQQIGERYIAAHLGDLLGTKNGVEFGEATEMMFGMIGGIKDAYVAAHRSRGKSLLPEDVSNDLTLRSKIEVPMGALNADTLGIRSTGLGKTMDLIDGVTRVPGSALRLADEFYKSIGYRMNLRATALRTAKQEVAAGKIPADGLKARIAQILDDPPEDIRIEAADAALYQTFTQKPDEAFNVIAKGVRGFNNVIPGLGTLIMPFKNTPINIMTYSLERTPLAPLVKQWRADIAAGGARSDIAMARTASGSALLLASMDWALNGNITGQGPQEPGERANWLRQGNQPYSVKVGDTWYAYNRLDPIGMALGFGADIADILNNSQEDYSQMEEMLIAATLSVANNMTSKTYMQGVSEFFDAMSDPSRYGEGYFQRIAGSLVPAVSGQAARQADPYMRTASSMIEAMKRRTPGLSADLPLYRDLWGRKVDYRSGIGRAWDILSPIYAKRENPEPIDTELERLAYFPSMPERKFSFSEFGETAIIDLDNNPKAYSRYVELAGNELVSDVWGMGAKDFLNAVVQGGHEMSVAYDFLSDGPDGGKAGKIAGWIAEYRKAAQRQIMDEFPELRAEFDTKKRLDMNVQF